MNDLKRRLGFGIPNRLRQEMQIQIAKDGYSLRDKSKWVTEAIENLLKLENFEELVSYGADMRAAEKMESIVLPQPVKVSLDAAVISVRKQYPSLEGVLSCIVRTAIIQRLLRD